MNLTVMKYEQCFEKRKIVGTQTSNYTIKSYGPDESEYRRCIVDIIISGSIYL